MSTVDPKAPRGIAGIPLTREQFEAIAKDPAGWLQRQPTHQGFRRWAMQAGYSYEALHLVPPCLGLTPNEVASGLVRCVDGWVGIPVWLIHPQQWSGDFHSGALWDAQLAWEGLTWLPEYATPTLDRMIRRYQRIRIELQLTVYEVCFGALFPLDPELPPQTLQPSQPPSERKGG